MVRVIGLDIIANGPGPDGRVASPRERLDAVVDNAALFEQLGFDGFAVGERHHVPFLSSAPPVILAAIAERTSTLKLFTGVTLLSEEVKRGTIEDVVTATGKILPRAYVDVGAQASGRLDAIPVRIGESVRQGDLLARIDPQVQTAQVEAMALFEAS